MGIDVEQFIEEILGPDLELDVSEGSIMVTPKPGCNMSFEEIEFRTMELHRETGKLLREAGVVDPNSAQKKPNVYKTEPTAEGFRIKEISTPDLSGLE